MPSPGSVVQRLDRGAQRSGSGTEYLWICDGVSASTAADRRGRRGSLRFVHYWLDPLAFDTFITHVQYVCVDTDALYTDIGPVGTLDTWARHGTAYEERCYNRGEGEAREVAGLVV